MPHITHQLNAALNEPRTGRLLLLMLGAVYLASYFLHPIFPGFGPGATTRGWWTWADQQWYLQEADAIAHGALDPKTYVYPVGYPALGALFVRWMPAHPFLIPDLLLVLAAAAIWWRIVRRWLGATEALLVGIVFGVTHRAILSDTMVVPWNTLVTQATLLAGVVIALTGSGPRRVLWLALLGGATYVARPIDAVAFAPLLLWATWVAGEWRVRITVAIAGFALVASAVAGIAALNMAIFDNWRTPYEVASVQILGFFGYPVLYKIFWLFVDMRPLFGESMPALLWRFPWLFLLLPAAVWWVRRERVAGAIVLTAVTLNAFIYVNYNDLLPSDIYRFNLIHYLTWWFPLMFAAAYAAVRHGWRDAWMRAAFAVMAGVFVFCGGWRMELRPLDVERSGERAWRLPPERPLFIRFPDTPMESIKDLRVDDRRVVEPVHFVRPHELPTLQLLLSREAPGERLSLVPGSSVQGEPVFGMYRWRWRVTPSWWRRLFPLQEGGRALPH